VTALLEAPRASDIVKLKQRLPPCRIGGSDRDEGGVLNQVRSDRRTEPLLAILRRCDREATLVTRGDVVTDEHKSSTPTRVAFAWKSRPFTSALACAQQRLEN
jgi:hypothetical protein